MGRVSCMREWVEERDNMGKRNSSDALDVSVNVVPITRHGC